jgi:hypothetical protein
MTPAAHLIEAARCVREASEHLDMAAILKSGLGEAIESIPGQDRINPQTARAFELLASGIGGLDLRTGPAPRPKETA